MARVYGLKHATPKMKYMHMIFMMDWKEDLKDSQRKFIELKQQNRDQFRDLLADMKLLDPNWEEWYDSKLPEFSGWEHAPLYEMKTRVLHLETRDEQPYLCRTGVL